MAHPGAVDMFQAQFGLGKRDAPDEDEGHNEKRARNDVYKVRVLTNPWTGLFVRKEWLKNGRPHREGGEPAIIHRNNKKEWWYNGRQHRENDLPAVKDSDGSEEWWYNGRRHRENDLPAVKEVNGRREWWYNGRLHRMGGPAVLTISPVTHQPVQSSKKYWFNGFHFRDPDVYWKRIQLMTPQEPFTSVTLPNAVKSGLDVAFELEFQTAKKKLEKELDRVLTQEEQVELEDEVRQSIVQTVTDKMHDLRAEVMEQEAPMMEELREEYPPASRWAGRIHIT